jgi:protein-S-isoprenylcysteine O-methyltransferase Ste14
MALIHSLESEGNFLFKYRGQFPVLLFIAAVPVVYFSNYDDLSTKSLQYYSIISLLLSVFGFLFRAYAIGTTPKGTSGRNTKNQVAEELNSTGIYSIVRHPLYVGNYFIWIGIVLFTFNLSFVIIVTLAYWLYYERIMFAEERFLEKKFGKAYLDWSLKAPAFIPSFKNYKSGQIPFSLKTVLRREYSGIFATVLGFLFVDILRESFDYKRFTYESKHLIIFGFFLFITLFLRSLKHYTKVLDEKDRS